MIGTLTDAGALVALLDADEQDHDACVRTLLTIELPMVTTWAAFTEAMYLLDVPRKARARDALWSLVETGRLRLHDLDERATTRARALMDKYADLPMDLADATLVAVAEAEGEATVFTIDSDFRIYRLRGRRAIQVVP
ncbi:MAG: PIN domain-containing protein [Nocardioidaceae bacterium]